jgi:lipopolysaccharide export system permease protein
LERKIDGIHEDVKQHPVLQMTYNFKPRDLQRDEYMKDKLSTKDLNEYIRLEKLRGSEVVNSLRLEKNSRDAGPPSVLILTMIGAIVASKKIRGGSGFHLAVGVVISVLYILVGRFASVFAMKGNFDPVLAAWMPNIFFGLLAYYLYRKAPK